MTGGSSAADDRSGEPGFDLLQCGRPNQPSRRPRGVDVQCGLRGHGPGNQRHVGQQRDGDAELQYEFLTSVSIQSGSVYSLGLTYEPNGNIATASDSVNGNWTYSYDALNRLLTAGQPGQAFSYVYDRYGNRWQQNVTQGTGP